MARAADGRRRVGSGGDVLAALRTQVDRALGAYLDEALPRVTAVHPALEPLVSELRALAGGGKRLRPVLVLVGYRSGGQAGAGPVMGPALALELLHTCALLHDDIIDAAEVRRGRPTTEVSFADRHTAHGWAGDPRDYGRAVALLLGDLAFVLADELFMTADVPADRLLRAFGQFTRMREELVAGQYLDVHAARARMTSSGLARTVARLKSAGYSVAHPLQIGGLLAGADDDLLAGMARFGTPVGEAFQLRDDVLGVFGDEAATGKSVASDLAEGKRTLLIARTAEQLHPAARARFEQLLGAEELTAEAVEELRATIRGAGGLAAVEREAEVLVQQALDVLGGLALAGDVREALREVAGWVMRRTA